MKKEVNALLSKEMDRLTFLKHVAAGFVVLTGASAVVNTLGTMGDNRRVGSAAASDSYGASVYGGSVAQTAAAVPARVQG